MFRMENFESRLHTKSTLKIGNMPSQEDDFPVTECFLLDIKIKIPRDQTLGIRVTGSVTPLNSTRAPNRQA